MWIPAGAQGRPRGPCPLDPLLSCGRMRTRPISFLTVTMGSMRKCLRWGLHCRVAGSQWWVIQYSLGITAPQWQCRELSLLLRARCTDLVVCRHCSAICATARAVQCVRVISATSPPAIASFGGCHDCGAPLQASSDGRQCVTHGLPLTHRACTAVLTLCMPRSLIGSLATWRNLYGGALVLCAASQLLSNICRKVAENDEIKTLFHVFPA